MGSGLGLALALLGCVALALFSIAGAPGPGEDAGVTSSNGTTYQWQLVPETAARLTPVYKPVYLPPGVSHPTIRVTTSGRSEVMTATYAGGLVLRQSNASLQEIAGSASLHPAPTRSGDQAA